MSNRVLLALSMLALMTVSSALPVQQEDIDMEFEQARKNLEQTDNPEEKAAIIKNFLLKYPDSQNTRRFLNSAWDVYIDQLQRPESFVELAELVRGKVENADLARSIDLLLLNAYVEAGDRSKLTALARTLASAEKVTFNTYYPIIYAATNAGEWQMVLDYCRQAERFASAEEYQREFPDNNLTPEELEQRGRNRLGLLFTHTGWAKANLGRRAEALADFAAADPLVNKSYLGYSDRGLDLYWGKTLLNDGKVDEAFDKLSRGAIFEKDDEIKAAFRDAYVARYSDAEGIDVFIEHMRKKIAVTIDDFTLPNYQGDKLTFSSLKGKVILMAFWNPN